MYKVVSLMNLATHLSSSDPRIASLIQILADQSQVISRAFLTTIGASNTMNVYGEVQNELEKFADQSLIKAMQSLDIVHSIASEEQPEIIETGRPGLSVAFDPLDGSSCIPTNLTVGTIMGIFDGPLLGEPKILAAAYVLYGPLTTLVYSTGKGVHEFVLENGEFILRRENLRIPEGTLIAPGGLKKDVVKEHRALLDRLDEEGFKIRYTGSFVADFSQILEYGGFYSYPALKGKPQGKLRLLFEAYPMAYLVDQAGGLATNGERPILGIRTEKVSQRIPLYIGSKNVVERIQVRS